MLPVTVTMEQLPQHQLTLEPFCIFCFSREALWLRTVCFLCWLQMWSLPGSVFFPVAAHAVKKCHARQGHDPGTPPGPHLGTSAEPLPGGHTAPYVLPAAAQSATSLPGDQCLWSQCRRKSEVTVQRDVALETSVWVSCHHLTGRNSTGDLGIASSVAHCEGGEWFVRSTGFGSKRSLISSLKALASWSVKWVTCLLGLWRGIN